MSSTIASARRRLKAHAGLLALCVTYAILLTIFSRLTDTRGLIAPSGAIDPAFLALGLAVLGLRIVVLFVVPLIAVYRLARWRLGEGE